MVCLCDVEFGWLGFKKERVKIQLYMFKSGAASFLNMFATGPFKTKSPYENS